MLNLRIVYNVIGVLLVLLGLLMLSAMPISIYFESGDEFDFLKSSTITIIVGLVIWSCNKNVPKKIGKREGYMIVALGWLSISLFCTLPYLISGTFQDFTNAFFESVSGLTTTGATVLTDIELSSHGILFWRSLTQWIGGMGIIVLTVAIFPLLGIGGVELFVAEAPGPTSDKIHPRIKETAKRLWYIYLGLSFSLCLLLYTNGMSFYDALNHSLTTMSTGGFSTKSSSIAYFNSPSIQYIICLFMFIAGINYTLIYFSLKANFKKVWSSDEFKYYLFLCIVLIFIVSISVFLITDYSYERAFRESSFQIISLITTTGYITADYTSWSSGLTMFFFILLFVGACAGSTSGGIKIIRHLVFVKNSILEFKRLLHPKSLIRIKIDNQIVAPRILTHILVFLLIYLMLFILGSVIMSIVLSDFDQPFISAVGASATCLGNVGPAIGQLGPLDNFAAIPPVGKWVLVLFMLLGRLELFTILIIFTPYFWKMN